MSESFTTPNCRVSFPSLFTPKPVAKGKDDVAYQAVVLVPPDADMTPFRDAMITAMASKWGKSIKLTPRNNPLKKGADVAWLGDEFDDWYVINVKNQYKPGVVDQQLTPITEESRIYSGCWMRFFLRAYGWQHPQGGQGVSFSLQAAQFVKDDQRLDGRKSATEVFDRIEIEEPEFGASEEAGGVDEFGLPI